VCFKGICNFVLLCENKYLTVVCTRCSFVGILNSQKDPNTNPRTTYCRIRGERRMHILTNVPSTLFQSFRFIEVCLLHFKRLTCFRIKNVARVSIGGKRVFRTFTSDSLAQTKARFETSLVKDEIWYETIPKVRAAVSVLSR
jgi:hypothetical protein